jgi:LAO/AO transport system kinase
MRLVDRVLAGDVKAAARLISKIEDETPDATEEMDTIYPHTGRAYVVGITGPPGAGKSTLTDNLIGFFRKKNMSVGVIAIDPTSALTGGAILGDRIRMQRHNTDKDVFIRSLATRGWIGGLAKATIGTIHVMDAMGKDIIMVETVGSGQVEIDIVKAADTTLVVLTPATGDEIQTMKAGILEAVNIFVINKADREGAERLKSDLEAMLMMSNCRPTDWQPSIILTEAVSDKGTEELAESILSHHNFLVSSGEMEKCHRERARLELLETVQGLLNEFIHRLDEGDYLEKLVDDVMQRRTNPHHAAREITARIAGELNNIKSRGKDGL